MENLKKNVLEKVKLISKDNFLSSKTPFNLQWIFGYNPKIPIINLTKHNDKTIILLACSHISTIYEITKNEQNHLLGHEHEIISLGCDYINGRFILTADKKVLNIWDRACSESKIPIPIRTIDDIYDKTDISSASLSYDGKYLVTVDTDNLLKFWLWTFGHEKADGEFQIPHKYGPVKNIKFSSNSNQYKYFAVTMTKSVVFGDWNYETKELQVHLPKVHLTNSIRHYNDTAYIQDSRKVISVTEMGEAIFWSDVICEPSDEIITNTKEYLKTLPVRHVSINVVVCVDDVIVTGDENGEIRFFDKEMKFLYWLQSIKFNAIISISFNLNSRNYRIEETLKFSPKSIDSKEVLFKETIPLDATMGKNPFIVRNFIVGTKTGEIGIVDFPKREYEQILYRCESHIVTFDAHPLKCWICVGNYSGRVSIYNYENTNILCEYNIPIEIIKLEENDDESNISTQKNLSIISCIKFSKSGNHLACGLENGKIWMLDPIILTPAFENPIKYTTSKIEKIVFSEDSNYMAYSDSDFRVVLLYFEIKWILIGKYKYHSKKISALLFFETQSDIPRFITIGEDRMLVEYDILSSSDGSLEIFYDLRIEQSAVSLSALLMPTKILNDSKTHSNFIIVTADNQYKIKFFDANKTENILNTFVGPIFDSPIQILKLIYNENNPEESFFVFCTEKVLGLQILPIDGNPFKSLGIIGNSIKIQNIELSHDFKYAFSLGEHDYSVMMWKINKKLVQENSIAGGKGLEPFCCSLPGGKSGWLFKELQDLFYYIQILCKGIDSAEDRQVIDYIPITEVIDFMRGIGFFPTDFEINNMISELTRALPDEIIPSEISFETLVKMYINHKPVNGVNLNKLIESLSYLNNKDNNLEMEIKTLEQITITKEKLFEILTCMGEQINDIQAVQYMKELIFTHDELKEDNENININDIMSQIPSSFNIKEFINNILGITLENNSSSSVDLINPIFNKTDDPSELVKQLDNKLIMELSAEINSLACSDDDEEDEDVKNQII